MVGAHRPTLIAAGLVVGTFLTYLPVLNCDLVKYDDPDYVSGKLAQGLTADGVRWAFTAIVSANWHPVTLLSLLLDHELFQEAPGAIISSIFCCTLQTPSCYSVVCT